MVRSRCLPPGTTWKLPTPTDSWVTWTGSPGGVPTAPRASRQTCEEPERVERK